MPPKTSNLAIMFADVSGSTKLFETLGDEIARNKISKCLDTLTSITTENHGTLIKTIGDEIMCTFPSADDAATASIQMQEAMEAGAIEDSAAGESVTLAIRVGFHFGPTIMEAGDVYGDAVNVAARMAAQAKGGQIITSQPTIDLLAPIMRASSRFVDRAPIKGKKEEINIYELIWQEEDVTRMATGLLVEELKPEVKLNISYNNQDFVLNKNRPDLMMGRSQQCDLPINEKLASRQHVKIELRRDKFFIIDQSTNGTHVAVDGEQAAFLRREEMPLHGSGQISLGRPFDEDPTEVVRFTFIG